MFQPSEAHDKIDQGAKKKFVIFNLINPEDFEKALNPYEVILC